jgi:hypothetical protein
LQISDKILKLKDEEYSPVSFKWQLAFPGLKSVAGIFGSCSAASPVETVTQEVVGSLIVSNSFVLQL